MVKKCSWGLCNSDTRYPERLAGGIKFLPFPKWIRSQPNNREKCIRWIKACNRPHEQLNIQKVQNSYHYYVCSKHFVDGAPSKKYPDPLPAPCSSETSQSTSATPKPSRPHHKDRSKTCNGQSRKKRLKNSLPACEAAHKRPNYAGDVGNTLNVGGDGQKTKDAGGLYILALAAEKHRQQNALGIPAKIVTELQQATAKQMPSYENLRRALQD